MVMPSLRDIVVGFAFYIGLRVPGRILGSPLGVRPFHSVDVRTRNHSRCTAVAARSLCGAGVCARV